jgi:hypothetical protein
MAIGMTVSSLTPSLHIVGLDPAGDAGELRRREEMLLDSIAVPIS